MEEIDEQYRQFMNDMARLLDNGLNGDTRPKRTGFMVLMFDFGGIDGQRMNYISNAEREDMICAMKEFVAKFEGRAPDLKGHA